jgi:serine/threonine-protein kinase RsbW
LSSGSKSTGRSATLRVKLRCDLADVRPKVDEVRRFLIGAGCSEEDALECELALVEACANAIQYADGQGVQQPVVIDAALHEAEAEFRVRDHTAGFEWPERSSLPDAESESGRGIFLIRSVMDSTEYIRQADGNVLAMRKRLARYSAKAVCASLCA